MAGLKVRKKSGSGYQHPDAKQLAKVVVTEKMVRLNVEISDQKRQALKMRAIRESKTVHEIINRLIDEYGNPPNK